MDKVDKEDYPRDPSCHLSVSQKIHEIEDTDLGADPNTIDGSNNGQICSYCRLHGGVWMSEQSWF